MARGKHPTRSAGISSQQWIKAKRERLLAEGKSIWMINPEGEPMLVDNNDSTIARKRKGGWTDAEMVEETVSVPKPRAAAKKKTASEKVPHVVKEKG